MNQIEVDFNNKTADKTHLIQIKEIAMAFEAFTNIKAKTPTEPKVSILKQGNFGLNAAVVKMIKEKNIEYLILMFDAETNRIAFKPAKKGEPGAYQIRHQKGSAQVSGLAFLKNYNIPFKEATKTHAASWNDELGMLIVQL